MGCVPKAHGFLGFLAQEPWEGSCGRSKFFPRLTLHKSKISCRNWILFPLKGSIPLQQDSFSLRIQFGFSSLFSKPFSRQVQDLSAASGASSTSSSFFPSRFSLEQPCYISLLEALIIPSSLFLEDLRSIHPWTLRSIHGHGSSLVPLTMKGSSTWNPWISSGHSHQFQINLIHGINSKFQLIPKGPNSFFP